MIITEPSFRGPRPAGGLLAEKDYETEAERKGGSRIAQARRADRPNWVRFANAMILRSLINRGKRLRLRVGFDNQLVRASIDLTRLARARRFRAAPEQIRIDSRLLRRPGGSLRSCRFW